MTNVFDNQATPDESLLLKFQEAKVRRDNAVLYGLDDFEFERDYSEALVALSALEDPALRDLARDAQRAGKRAVDAVQQLLELSLRIRNLFPLFSHSIN
jgi:hypothetical protein